MASCALVSVPVDACCAGAVVAVVDDFDDFSEPFDGRGGAPGLHLERTRLGDLRSAVPGLTDGEGPLRLATTLLVREDRDREDGRPGEAGERAVGVVDLRTTGRVGLDRVALLERH